MAALVTRRVRTTQPQSNIQIDWSNPLTQGLVFAYTCGSEAQGWGEDGRNGIPYVVTSTGAPTGRTINTPSGQGGQLISSSSPYLFGSPTQASVKSGVYSLFAFGTGPASGMQSALDDDDGTTRRFQFRLNAGKVEFIPFYSGGNGDLIAPTALSAVDLASGFAMGATVNGTAAAVYQKGVKTAATLGGAALAPNASINVGARKTGVSQCWLVGGLQIVAMWNRPLTDAEHTALADNPWQLFTARRRRMWMSPAAFAAYVLRAETATFLASASQAVLSVSRRLVAAAGEVVSGWAPANLIVSRRLPADAASFTMTGISASIRAARKLATNVGSFGLAGTAAPMIATRRLAAQPGAFVLSPGAVQMVYTPAPGPGGPTYTLAASTGAFDLTAGAVAMYARRRLLAVSGAFEWSATAAALLVGRRLPTAAGTFAVDSAPAALRAARRMPADTGAFSLAGADVQLRYSAHVAYARAPSGAGYAPTQHYNDSRPAATSSPRPAATQRNQR